MLSALLHTGRLICACTTAICLMWLVWGFFWYSKGGNHTAEKAIHGCRVYVCVQHISASISTQKKENNVLGSGSLSFMAALQFSNTDTLVPLQCKSSTSIFQDKKAQTLSLLLHMVYFGVSAHATVQ